MYVTLDAIKALLGLMDKGIIHGAGRIPSQFCVQQAVSLATGGSQTDRPWCVNPNLRDLGIAMNDANVWYTNESRAQGLRRFAVAEMGTDEKFCSYDFTQKLAKHLGLDNFSETESNPLKVYQEWLCIRSGEQGISDFANACADIMLEMDTPGSRHLHYCDERYSKKEAAKIVKQETKKAFSSQMASFGTNANAKKTTTGFVAH